jgi:hypothetical protein
VPYVPVYLHDYVIALPKRFIVPHFSIWHFYMNDYGLQIKPAS